MDLANLSNEQQALVLDQQLEQQRLLSDQAAENAAFNNIITTTDNSTTVSSNQLNVGDYAIDGSDATAKSLAAMGYGN